MTSIPTLQELIETIRDAARSDDELEQLATASSTVTEINETTDAALGYFVDRARSAGRSWVEISTVLGVTKQAVHKRFAGPAATRSLDRFTERARTVLDAATTVAAAAGHNYVGTEHMLLAQYAEPDAVAARVLHEVGITRDAVHQTIQARTPDLPEPFDGTPSFTPRAAEAMAGALSEALQLGHNYIGTEHMLLALYRDPNAFAGTILTQLGLDAQSARSRLLAALTR